MVRKQGATQLLLPVLHDRLALAEVERAVTSFAVPSDEPDLDSALAP